MLVSYATVFVNAIAVAVAGVAAVRVFWGPPESPRGQVHEVSWRMFVPPLADPLLLAAARSISPALGATDLSAAYDLDILLSATGITAAVGLLFFLTWDRLHHGLQRLHWLDRFGPAALYDALLHALTRIAAWQTRHLQHGRLTGYMRLTLAALLAMGSFAWLNTDSRMVLQWDWPSHAWAWAVACLLV